jgi:U3 small nucleolar RNA-associated protein 14
LKARKPIGRAGLDGRVGAEFEDDPNEVVVDDETVNVVLDVPVPSLGAWALAACGTSKQASAKRAMRVRTVLPFVRVFV